MIAILPKTISYRAIALAYEDEVLAAWYRLRMSRRTRDAARRTGNTGTDHVYTAYSYESKQHLLDLLNIRKRARKAGR